MTIERPGVRTGYDIWAETYDATPNPVVHLDARVTPTLIQVAPGERVLDAGCGTGRHFPTIHALGGRTVGLDFSAGMLHVARRNHPDVPLVMADLERRLPFADATFDAVLCSLVGEHLERLDTVFGELTRVLRPGGPLVFTVYHPDMAAAGKEANFRAGETEFRLGAVRHAVDDYRSAMRGAGVRDITTHELRGDRQLVDEIPSAAKFLDFPVLLVLRGVRRDA